MGHSRQGGLTVQSVTDSILIQAFGEYQQRRNFSPKTVRSRYFVLTPFSTHLRPRGLLKATPEDVERWLATRRLGPQGRYSYLSHLHAFYRWATRRGLTTTDPTEFVDRPKVPKRLPRPILPGELEAALRAADPAMRAWLFLGAFAGLRRAEIAHLQRDDVLDQVDPPLLRVSNGKGAKDGTVPLHPAVLDALVAAGLPRSGPVFRTRAGRPATPDYVGDRVARFLRDTGIDRTCHSTRHHFGTEVYRLCKDLLMTRDLMRHANAASSEGYVELDAGPAADIVNRLGRAI